MRSRGMAVACGLVLAAGWPQGAGAAGPGAAAEMVSVATGGGQGDGASDLPSITADGRYVAFESVASDLVPGDVNGVSDVFVRDRVLGTTVMPVTTLTTGLFIDGVYDAALNPDGRYLTFTSWAPDLVPGDTNELSDVFLKDLQTGAVERISVTSAGAETTGGISWGGQISPDGRFVTFTSRARNLLPPGRDKNSSRGADAFVRDRLLGTTTLVSVALDGLNGFRPSYSQGISADGRYAAFVGWSPDLVADDDQAYGLFLRDLQTGVTTRETPNAADGGNGYELHQATMSPDARWITFESKVNTLVPGDANDSMDIFVRDRVTGTIELVSLATDGSQANGDSWGEHVADGGRCVTFTSAATNLVPGDTNGKDDIFVRDLAAGTTTRVSVDHASGGDADGNSDPADGEGTAVLRPDGSEIAYPSEAANLVATDTNGAPDIFVSPTGC
ncbi:hypothetical protein [Actinoplanes sp. N902-109]|uniref:TolB family protein n=1 Tax=Actinoplanes sp. (strain N902-109) TaxID=649831 RepID=UPI00032948D2|nr:hypothetical protein [Actinoplanes sp. N902-109]AGL17458.1 WD40 domain-containing protein [Actinoplanes sp. N902-109]